MWHSEAVILKDWETEKLRDTLNGRLKEGDTKREKLERHLWGLSYSLLELLHVTVRLWHCEIVRLWDFETVRLLDLETVRHRDFKNERMWNWDTVRLWECETEILWDFKTVRMWDCEVVRRSLRDWEIMRLTDYETVRLWDFKIDWLRDWEIERLRESLRERNLRDNFWDLNSPSRDCSELLSECLEYICRYI